MISNSVVETPSSGGGGFGRSLAFFRYSEANPFAGWSSTTAVRFFTAVAFSPSKNAVRPARYCWGRRSLSFVSTPSL